MGEKDPLKDINEKYKDITDPKNWVKMFPTMESFKKWVTIGTLKDVESTLKEFEKAELYEYCAVILEVIKDKTELK
jgi:hypothetical protein